MEVDEEVGDEGVSLLEVEERVPRPVAECYGGCSVRLGSMRQLFGCWSCLLQLPSTTSYLESCQKKGQAEGNIRGVLNSSRPAAERRQPSRPEAGMQVLELPFVVGGEKEEWDDERGRQWRWLLSFSV